MRLLPGFSIAFVLALLLIGTTPMGTGTGAHQFDLVHPLFAHVHIVNGRVLTHDQVQQGGPGWQRTTTSSPGPALGAGSGASQTLNGLGISPIVPTYALGLSSGPLLSRKRLTLRPPAGRRQEAPPEPPPTSAR